MIGAFLIGERRMGPGEPPLVVAELSANHNQSLDRALALVDAAADAGAHAVKIQTYTADTLTIDADTPDFLIDDPSSLWHGKTLHELYRMAHTPWEWHEDIFSRCRQRGMIYFSTPFDATAVDFLESLSVPAYKVASFENADIPLIRKIAATGKPMIISTGMATLAELDETIREARQGGCGNLVLLKCTSSYPADPASSNLLTIPRLSEIFNCPVGLSDHTPGIGAAVASVALGAVMVEKHFCLSRDDGGVDAPFSLEPAELSALVKETEMAHQALGRVRFGPMDEERGSMIFRRSLYVVRDMTAGEALSPENMRSIRPGYGLPPRYYDVLLGKRVTRDLARGTPLSWDVIQ